MVSGYLLYILRESCSNVKSLIGVQRIRNMNVPSKAPSTLSVPSKVPSIVSFFPPWSSKTFVAAESDVQSLISPPRRMNCHHTNTRIPPTPLFGLHFISFSSLTQQDNCFGSSTPPNQLEEKKN